MEERRRETGSQVPAGDSPAPRRRGAGMKRKASGSVGSQTSSASSSSKRAAREKAFVPPLPPHPIHDGPLTRARQFADAAAATSFEARILQAQLVSAAEAAAAQDELEELSASRKHSEALEAAIEAEVEAIRARGANAHVIPVPAGWFSWEKVHHIEKHSLPSFFSGKSENRSPEVYVDIRNWIVNKFHANPGVNIESKDLADLSIGELDAREEVMEFFESWGLINYNPFPSKTEADNREIEGDKGKQKLLDISTDGEKSGNKLLDISADGVKGDNIELGVDTVSDMDEKRVLNAGDSCDEKSSTVIAGADKDVQNVQDAGTEDKKVEADVTTTTDKNGKTEPGVGSDAAKVEKKESAVDTTVNKDEKIKTEALIEKLYRFETEESYRKILPKSNLATPAVPVGFFHESAIAEDMMKQEGPAYHCNSCSADCSRKRYHCQKQADFDLCSECYTNGKFGSGMSPSDFILMEPGDVSGATGGKWTDQETLLLLEALELYRENWNEIAEHVATKTKAQCILHFLQMPIEDTFLNSDDDAKDTVQEEVDLSSTKSDHVEDPNTAKIDHVVDPNTTKSGPVEDPNTGKSGPVEDPNTGKSGPVEDPNTGKSDPVEDPNTGKSDPVEDQITVKPEPLDSSNTAKPEPEEIPITVKPEPTESPNEPAEPSSKNADSSEPREASEALEDQAGAGDVQPAPSPMIVPEVDGTQDMEVTKEIDGDLAVRALKEAFEAAGSLFTAEEKFSFADAGNPVMSLAAFLTRLVEPEMSAASARCSFKSMGKPSAGLQLSLMHCLLLEDQPDVQQDPDGSESERAKKVEQDTQQEEKKEIENQNDVNDDMNHSTTQNEKSISTCANDSSNDQVDVEMKDCDTELNPSEKQGVQKLQENDHPVEGAAYDLPDNQPKDVADDLPDNQPKDVAEERPLDAALELKEASTTEDSHSKETPLDVNMESESIVAEKEPHKPDQSDPLVEDEAKTENNHERDTKTGDQKSEETKDDQNNRERDPKTGDQKSEETKDDQNTHKLKQAAMTTLAAAAVKAKLLITQEEDSIRQLAALLIEKQLRKLELKLGYFAEMENLVTRIREHMDRSRQKLYHERAQIIAARLGLPSSASRAVPSMLPAGRGGAAMGSGNPILRPPMGMMMGMQRPPLTSRPVMASAPATSAVVPPTVVEGGGTLTQPSKH